MEFTAKDVLNTAIKIAKANPDFVYTDQEGYEGTSGYSGYSEYTDEGTPCIVGSALIELGVTREQLIYEDRIAETVVPLYTSDSDHDEKSLVALNHIQSQQDLGSSWGESIKGYDK